MVVIVVWRDISIYPVTATQLKYRYAYPQEIAIHEVWGKVHQIILFNSETPMDSATLFYPFIPGSKFLCLLVREKNMS